MATYSNGTLFKWQPIQMVPYSNGIRLFKQYPIQRGNDTWFMFRKKRTGLKGLQAHTQYGQVDGGNLPPSPRKMIRGVTNSFILLIMLTC